MTIDRTIVSPAVANRLRATGTRIAPGIWRDAYGGVHFSVPELLTYFGWPDDARHRLMVQNVLAETLAIKFPDTTVIITEVEP